VSRIGRKAVSLAFRMAKTAQGSMRELDHLRGLPAVEIFFTALWILAALVWVIAIKVGAVRGMRAGIFGLAGIIAVGWVVLKALRARTRREMKEYYGSSSDS
jgi:hypothetical protein